MSEQVRDIEDRSILQALEMQKDRGVDVFTDGEYRRDIFTADITKAMDGLVPGKPAVKFEWRGEVKRAGEDRKKAISNISSAESCAEKAVSRLTKRHF